VDEWILRRFVDTEYGRLVGAMTAIFGGRAAAEDAVQEALIRAWERAERGERIESLGAWVTTVALNLGRNRLRHLRVERRAHGGIVQADAAVPGPDAAGVDLRRALARLPRRQREALVLRYYLDLDVEEVAWAMGAPAGTVKSLLFRARASLAATLGVDDVVEVNGHDAR
jgi:RNA polymerase sigma factor (sigma-70 family)